MSYTFFDRNGNPSEFTTEAFISAYEKYYYLNDRNNPDFIPAISVNSRVSENEIERILSEGISRKEDVNTILAWKIGGIDHAGSKEKVMLKADWKNETCVKELYFKCERNQFDSFCEEIAGIAGIAGIALKHNHNSVMQPFELIKLITESAQNHKVPLGTVYTLTILYFITKGGYPIFDRFAYTAVKSIYVGIKPKDIWYENPSRKKPEDILKVINEYMWFLKQVFGSPQIPRCIDRALWVYGHPKVIKNND